MYAKSVGWCTWWHEDTPPPGWCSVTRLRFIPPGPPVTRPQLRPCSPLRTEKAATPPENNGACPRGHRGHRAQQITRTPPCNAIMSSERPGQLIDLLLSMAQSWHMEPVEAGRGKLQLGAGAHCAILCVCIQRTGRRRANVCKSALLL